MDESSSRLSISLLGKLDCQKLKDGWNGAADAAVCNVDTCDVIGTAVGEVFA